MVDSEINIIMSKKTSSGKNRYRFKKQWDKIFSNMLIPRDIPIQYTKNIKIILENGEEFISRNSKEFESQVERIAKSGNEIDDLMIEINFEKLITDVENTFDKILTSD